MAKRAMLPRLSRIDFFCKQDDGLAFVVANAIANHNSQTKSTDLTCNHAAISAWSAIMIDVPNGGFTQFFYSRGNDDGVADLVNLLDNLDLPKAVVLLRDAHVVYMEHRQQFDVSNPWDGLFGSIEAFDALGYQFVRGMRRCNRVINAWIRDHITDLATDETRARIDVGFTGTVETHHPNGQIRESLEVRRGKPHGAYHEYFEDGSIRNAIYYRSGKESADFWPSGQVKRKESRRGKLRLIEWFYPSGAVQKRHLMNKVGHAVEPIRLYHENGQLAEELSTVEGDKCGPWTKFFEDGTAQLQAEHTSDETLIVHNAWNENREQIVKNGSGTFRDYSVDIDWEYAVFSENSWIRESELKNGIPNGKVKTFCDGVLWSVASYSNGELDGESTLYWDNGRVRSVTQYVHGNEGTPKTFPKFDRPSPKVVLRVQANEDLYAAWKHIPVDEYPHPVNLDVVQKNLKVPAFLDEVHERNLSDKLKDDYEDWNTFDDGIAYFLTVDDSGKVISVTANGSGVYSVGELETYPPILRHLRFKPGRIRGRAIECTVLARIDHKFAESES